jgi:hypothetical protein
MSLADLIRKVGVSQLNQHSIATPASKDDFYTRVFISMKEPAGATDELGFEANLIKTRV